MASSSTQYIFIVDNVTITVFCFTCKQKLVGISESPKWQMLPSRAVSTGASAMMIFHVRSRRSRADRFWKRRSHPNLAGTKSGHSPIVIAASTERRCCKKTPPPLLLPKYLAKEFRKHVLFMDLDPQTNATIN